MHVKRPLCPKCGEPARRVIVRAGWVKCELLEDGSLGRVLGCGNLNRLSTEEYESNKEAAEGQLDSGLRYLAQAIKSAREDLAKGRPLDAHLIHNANALTQSIMQYNLSLDLLPYVEEKE